MTKRSYLFFAVTAFVLSVASITARAQGPNTFKADIPFDFTVGKTRLPAGTYTITLPQTAGAPTVSLRSSEGNSSVVALTNWTRSSKPEVEKGLMFVKAADGYHLYQVHVPGREIGQQLRQNRKVAVTLARLNIDLKPARSE